MAFWLWLSQKYGNPQMGCPGKWNQGLNFHPYPNVHRPLRCCVKYLFNLTCATLFYEVCVCNTVVSFLPSSETKSVDRISRSERKFSQPQVLQVLDPSYLQKNSTLLDWPPSTEQPAFLGTRFRMSCCHSLPIPRSTRPNCAQSRASLGPVCVSFFPPFKRVLPTRFTFVSWVLNRGV